MNKLEAFFKLCDMVDSAPAPPLTSVDGFGIVIADRGHIWVGELKDSGEWIAIRRARAVRKWGTQNGINELAANGPLEDTKLDAPASLLWVRKRAVIACIPSEESKWTT